MKKQKIHNLSLWKKYKKASTTKRKSLLEKKLVEIYYPLVQKISYKVSEKIGWRLSPEELTSMGVDGLYVAIRRFSLDRGVNFPTYSNRRIRGSMIDGIRKNDIIPRSVRINWNIINKARNNLEIQKGRKVIAVECKASTAPKLTKGFWRAIEIVKPEFTYVVAPVLEKFPVAKKVLVCNLNELIHILTNSL